MSNKTKNLLIVGDNPFHGISHLSQDRARQRNNKIKTANYAAELVMTSVQNGANGFMFSVSDLTLSTLEILNEKSNNFPTLYAIVPYAYEYVRLAASLGTAGLATHLGKQVMYSRNLRTIANGLKGFAMMDPVALLKTYVLYELSRIKSVIGAHTLKSIILHEVVTDMFLALNLDWIIKAFVNFVTGLGITPGFETRNFPYLVNKFKKWKINFNNTIIVASFNKAGFQMNPSKKDCESALKEIPECNIIAMSVLAAGYLKLFEAIEYIESLSNLNGVVVGVSKEKHAYETFSYLKSKFL